MKKELDKLKEKVKLNKKMLVFLFGLTLMAITSGAIFVTLLSKTDQSLVSNHISQFLNNIETNNLDYLVAFKNSFLSNITFILIIWLLGISVIGIPIMIFMYFSKAFIFGFSISNMILNYKLSGCLLSFIYIFPHHIINLIIFVFLITYSFAFSSKIINAAVKKKTLDFQLLINKYFKVLLVCLIGIFITTIIEIFITPVIIKTILPLLK